MRWKAFLKEHSSVVVLGMPSAPLRYLLALRRKTGGPPILVVHRPSLLLSFIPLAHLCRRTSLASGELLLLELSDLAARLRERRLILLPADEESRKFTEKYREQLESNYVIRDGGLGKGDLYDTF